MFRKVPNVILPGKSTSDHIFPTFSSEMIDLAEKFIGISQEIHYIQSLEIVIGISQPLIFVFRLPNRTLSSFSTVTSCCLSLVYIIINLVSIAFALLFGQNR